MVVAKCYYGDLYICRPGDDDWMKVPTGTKHYFHVFDMIFYKGELYCIDEEWIMAYDIQHMYDNINNFSPAPAPAPAPRDGLVYHEDDAWCNIYGDEQQYSRKHYLVESGGELLVVTQYVSTKFNYDHIIEFTVHRADLIHTIGASGRSWHVVRG